MVPFVSLYQKRSPIMNYRHYTVADFVTDPFFRSWVLDQDSGAADFWENWMKENTDRREELGEARALLYVLAGKERQVGTEELDGHVRNLLAKVGEPVQYVVRPVKPAFYRYLSIAASVLVVAGLGWFAYRYTLGKPQGEVVAASEYQRADGHVVYFNRTTKPVTIRLEDSSIVTLASESELKYPEKFAQEKREVFLNGEAFFQISHNPDRPFLVRTNELVTRVLGTSFTVRSFEKDPDASVSVKSGRVSVYAKKDELGAGSAEKVIGVVLKPNQRALFDKQESRLMKVIVDVPVRVSEVPAASLVFDEAPVGNVFKTLEKTYGIELFFNERVLSHCQLTANLTGLPMYEQLDLICRIIDARYEVVDGQVIIHGEGCKAN